MINKFSTEQKVIGGIGLFTLIIIVGGVFLLSKGEEVPDVPEEEIIARSGLHWHPKLEIYIKGEKQEIPANIGIGGQIHQEIHTHETDGVIHMEMGGLVTKDETKLGNFFRIWGKEFSSTRIFDKENGEEGTVRITVNGQENTEFENYEVKDGDKIEIRYD